MSEPQVFVSYAWGDATHTGKARQRVVDALCAALKHDGVEIQRDIEQVRPGELISEFMDRLSSGDQVLVILSDRYLRSPYCIELAR
jgi:internalin A